MAKVKFKFSVEKITFEYEGDQDTGIAVNRAMNHTLGSLIEAQNRVIDVTPEPLIMALPPAASPPVRRKYRSKPKAPTHGQPTGEEPSAIIDQATPKSGRLRRPNGSSFRYQMYPLIREGYFKQARTASELNAELSRRGYHYNSKSVASELLWFVQKHYLSRDRNADSKYAYVKGTNNDFPATQSGS